MGQARLVWRLSDGQLSSLVCIMQFTFSHFLQTILLLSRKNV